MVATALQPNAYGSSSTSNTAGTQNTNRSPTLGTQPTAVERQHVSDLQEQFQQQAQKDPAGFRLALREAFGDKASLAQIDQLLDMALAGKLPMPSNIQFVETGSLGSHALGAYDSGNGGSLYLDRLLLSDPTKLQSVFNEEMGHHLDALLGGADAAGDEGAVFSRTLEQGPLSQSELTSLKNENDHGFIKVKGEWIEVEFRSEHEGSGNGQEPSSEPETSSESNTSNESKPSNGSVSDNDNDSEPAGGGGRRDGPETSGLVDEPDSSPSPQEAPATSDGPNGGDGNSYDDMIEDQQTQAANRPSSTSNNSDNDQDAEPGAATASDSENEIDPDSRTANTSDGLNGGDPDDFQTLTGNTSNRSPGRGDNDDDSVAAGTVIAPPIPPGAATPQPGFWSRFGTWAYSFVGSLLGGAGRGIQVAVASPGAMAAGVMSLLWSPALGGRQQTHSIVGADGTIKNYPDSLEGTVTIDGTEISVIATGVDANGYPTGFVPATRADAQKLEDLGVNVSRDSGVIDTAPLNNESSDESDEVTTVIEPKIEKQMGQRGWDEERLDETIENPDRTVETRDTRWNADGTRRDEPATAYIDSEGDYVVRNDNDGTVVQVSDRNDPDWQSPWD